MVLCLLFQLAQQDLCDGGAIQPKRLPHFEWLCLIQIHFDFDMLLHVSNP